MFLKRSSLFKRLIFIIFITLVSVFIALPRSLPLNIHFQAINFEKTLVLPQINFKIGSFTYQKELELKLGLDLAGGSHLVFEADSTKVAEEDKKDAIEAARETIERRVNLFGVSEALVQTSKVGASDRILVELPGVKDTESAIGLIGRTAQLEFMELEYSKEGTPSGIIPTGFTGADFKRAKPAFDQTSGKPIISFETKTESAQKFADLTTRLVGKELIISLDGNVISAPVVNSPITGGQGQITGNFTQEETKSLSSLLNSGALPLPIHLIEQRTVEAGLGAESVKASIAAGLVGLSMVIIFMSLYYGRLGVIACIGLIIYGFITLAIYKLWPVVLTLPGVAGFILSVGMAVDSNILIFERLKEELRMGNSWTISMERAFGRAWDSIRDANIATLLTVFILFNPLNLDFLHTSGPVRGFAFTLGLGIAISLFTGIFVTRTLLRLLISRKDSKKK